MNTKPVLFVRPQHVYQLTLIGGSPTLIGGRRVYAQFTWPEARLLCSAGLVRLEYDET